LDETWLGQSDFRRMHWRPIDRNCSIPRKMIAPRISMIVAVSSHGDVWLSLTHSNSNKSMMGIFVEKLCLKLDKHNPHWRNSTILTWDGKFRSPEGSICILTDPFFYLSRSPISQSSWNEVDAGASVGANHDEWTLQLRSRTRGAFFCGV
jgi:hypothetical protein